LFKVSFEQAQAAQQHGFDGSRIKANISGIWGKSFCSFQPDRHMQLLAKMSRG
jgi:hypothetical protein